MFSNTNTCHNCFFNTDTLGSALACLCVLTPPYSWRYIWILGTLFINPGETISQGFKNFTQPDHCSSLKNWGMTHLTKWFVFVMQAIYRAKHKDLLSLFLSLHCFLHIRRLNGLFVSLLGPAFTVQSSCILGYRLCPHQKPTKATVIGHHQNLPSLVALHTDSTVLASSWELPWLSWLPSLSWAELGVVCNWDQKTLPSLNGSSHKGWWNLGSSQSSVINKSPCVNL